MLAPENTIAAIDVGREFGHRAIEFDTRLARNDVPVVIHDATLERTTNGAGPVVMRSAAELAQLDAGRWRAPRFAGTPVPTLAVMLDHCRAHQVWPNVEIKALTESEERTGEIAARAVAARYHDLVRPDGDRADLADPGVPLLSSFSPAALIGARRGAPWLPRGLLVDGISNDWRRQLEALGCVSLHVDHAFLTEAQARAVKAAGYWLFCFTVDEPTRAREILAWGADAFCTDRIDLIGPDFV